MKQNEQIPHLFRTEYSKITAVLCNLFGIAHMAVAEDLASETFLAAVETWPYKGIPDNPTAWLYAVAKNKAKNYLKHNDVLTQKIQPQLKNSTPKIEDVEINLSPQHIMDSQLQMLFAVCHPCISVESQICLALRTLCGFGIDEIADAFLSNKETINKRLLRAKEKLRKEKIAIEMPAAKEIEQRLEAVLRTVYLLFNEGYYSERKETVVRKELCMGAMKLTYLLLENEQTNRHETNSLMALMCFHASRLDARQDEQGSIILYRDQEETLWNSELIERGFYYLQNASKWGVQSKYYIEASIAYWHTIKRDSQEKWEPILQLYNCLLQIEYSPIAALNRTFALAKARSKEEAIPEAEKLNLEGNHFYYVLLAELYSGIDTGKALNYLQQALATAQTAPQKEVIKRKLKEYKSI